jgi:WD40-like Beta Propeller Repeat
MSTAQPANGWAPIETSLPARMNRAIRLIVGLLIMGLGLAAFAGFRWWTKLHRFNPQNMHIEKLTDSGKVQTAAISPDGRYIVYALVEGEQQSLWVRNVATKSDVQVLSPDVVLFDGLSFSPDGNYIYFTRSEKGALGFHNLYVMPVLGGAQRRLLRDIDGPVSFSPNGKQFAFTRGVINDHSTVEVRIANMDGHRMERPSPYPRCHEPRVKGSYSAPSTWLMGRFENSMRGGKPLAAQLGCLTTTRWWCRWSLPIKKYRRPTQCSCGLYSSLVASLGD